MSTEFKLIAIRPLKECEGHIRKCLSIGETYYFSNDYKISEDGEEIDFRKSNLKPLSNRFFSLGEKQTTISPVVNISAIVGKNGDGKSSIIELMMRLINNCALYYNFNIQYHDLLKAKGVNAVLYYRINDDFFYLKEENSDIAIYHIAKIIHEGDQLKIKLTKRKLEENEVKKEFFYTMVSNYSHYAYNIYDFNREWDPSIRNQDDNEKCWLFKIFHKNDGYQTPLVLHPYRDKGNIDVNIEKYLSSQRLLTLFINATNPENDSSSFRNINDQYAELLLLKEPKSSKLQDKIIIEYFEEVRGKSLLESIIINLEGIIDQTSDLKQVEKQSSPIDHYLKEIEEYYLDPLNRIWQKVIKPNKKIFDTILKWLPEFSINNLSDAKTDLAILLNKLSILSNNLSEVKYKSDTITNINKVVDNYSSINYFSFNILQIQRIDLVDHICDIWSGQTNLDINLEDYSFDLTNATLIKSYSELSLLEKSYHYIIYKTIQILDRYPNYNDSCYGFNNLALAFENRNMLKEASDSVNNGFVTLFKDLKEDKSHITLKLRQSLNFKIEISKNKDIYKKIEHDTFNKYNESIKGTLIEQEGPQTSNNLDDSNYFVLSLEELKKYYNKEVIELDQLPPPIFQCDIYLKHIKEKEIYTPVSALSSGEKQMLNSISAIVYHLQNISSVPSDGLVKYSFVNLVLEEIELYFHPEYQRSFIKSLLSLIHNANLNKIKGINIIFVTHSPFILSDIPKRNVLFLEGGMPTDKMQENTFGANIHSLLKNGFFLDTLPIGDFAHSKINTLFAKLNSGDFSNDEFEDMYQDILLVGESYLRGQLLSLYNSYKLPKTEFKREQIYTKRISELESWLLDLDKQVSKAKNDKSK